MKKMLTGITESDADKQPEHLRRTFALKRGTAGVAEGDDVEAKLGHRREAGFWGMELGLGRRSEQIWGT